MPDMKRRVIIKISLLCAAVAVLLLLLFSGGGRTALIYSDDLYSEDFVMGVVPFSPAQPHAEASGAKVEYFNDFFAAANALAAGQIDGFADDVVLLDRYSRLNPDTALMYQSYGETDICGVMRTTDEALYYRVNAFIAAAKKDGLLDQLRDRWYYGETPELPETERPEDPAGTLRILTGGSCEPYSYVGKNGQLTGLEIELGMRLASYLNMDWEFVVVDSYSLISSLDSGRGDIILSTFNKSAEAEKILFFTYPYITVKTGVMVQSSRFAGSGTETEESLWDSAKRNFVNTFVAERRWQMILSGVGVTLLISFSSFLLGNVLADLLCEAKRSKNRFSRDAANIIIKLINGIPILVLIMLLYYVMFRGIDISGIAVAIIGFALSCGAELALLFETGIDSVGKSQLEAAESIGFTRSQTFRLIILPQAAQTIFALYTQKFVSLIKSTSVVGYIAVMDLTKVNDLIRSRTYAPFFPLICSTVMYFLITELIVLVFTRISHSFDPIHKPRTPRGVKLE